MAKAKRKERAYEPVDLTLETEEEFRALLNLVGLADVHLEMALKKGGYGELTKTCESLSKIWNALTSVEYS